MTRLRPLILVVLLCAPVAVADAQKKPAKPPAGSEPYGLVPTVSIAARPDPIVIGNTTTISGSLRTNTANVRISLQSRSYAPRGTFTTIAATTTDRRGDYRFAPRPRVNTVYRVLAATTPAARSSERLVRVRMRVGVRTNRGTVRAGSFVRFTGRVFSRHNGRRAYIQRRSPAGRWVTVARPMLRTYDATSSRYSRRVRVRRTGVYRVKVLGHADHTTGFSRLVRVTAV